MKKSLSCLFTILGIMVLFGSSSLLQAQPPDITVDLSFDKSYYAYGEPIEVTVEVKNDTGRNVYISKGFSEKDYYLQMRVIDPAGRLILPQLDLPHEEFPDAPALPFCSKDDGTFTRVAPYEILSAGWSKTSFTNNLRAYYPLKFPGNYSFQVQLSAMTWNPPQGDPCISDINNYESLVVFKSETKYIGAEGSTEVHIIPEYWEIAWKDYPYLDYVVAAIWPENGKTVDDYDRNNIYLNNVKAAKIRNEYSYMNGKYYLKALFNRQAAINSLGDVEVGYWYPVVISGAMKGNNGLFGGGAKVEIIN